MNRFFRYILFGLLCALFLLPTDASAQRRGRRKKVAVVLSGGGAKGVAHVSALKVIEEAGIPIDIIVGTSMGSIVGGLYCSGYTTHQLDSIVRAQNWALLLTDGQERSQKSMYSRQLEDRYVVSATFDKSPFEVIEGGLLKGNNIGRFFSELTADHLDSMSYSKLPIPFACVATDIVSGNEVVMRSGILAESMRSSMAIPGVFPPIKKNGMVLVDGGLVNNYPVDVARRMGADVVIGVDVTDKHKTAEQINSTGEVLLRILDVICSNKYKENVEKTDVHINVNVNGYSSASFSKVAIDTLLERGNMAAREKWDELLSLKEHLGRIEPLAVRKPKILDADTVVTPVASIYNDHPNASFIGFGARFDNEELATLLLGGSYEFNHKRKARAGFELRLGKRMYGKLRFEFNPWGEWTIGARYQHTSNDTKVYNNGDHMATLDYYDESFRLSFRRSWHKMLVAFGADWNYSHYNNLLRQTDWIDFVQTRENDRSFSYFANIAFDSQDASVMPRRGMKWTLRYTLFTDNMHEYNGGLPLHIVEGFFEAALPVSRKFTLMPSVAGRLLPNRNTHLNNLNVIGGIDTYGHYMEHQIPFAGVNHIQIVPNNILVLGMRVRHNVTTNNYMFGIANSALAGNALEKIVTVNSTNMYGAAIGYGYKSPIGPIEFNLNWSNITESVGAFLNIGYMF